MTKSSKQRSIRFGGDLEQRLEEMAEREGRTFSGQVNWMIRQALAQRQFDQGNKQRQAAA